MTETIKEKFEKQTSEAINLLAIEAAKIAHTHGSADVKSIAESLFAKYSEAWRHLRQNRDGALDMIKELKKKR